MEDYRERSLTVLFCISLSAFLGFSCNIRKQENLKIVLKRKSKPAVYLVGQLLLPGVNNGQFLIRSLVNICKQGTLAKSGPR